MNKTIYKKIFLPSILLLFTLSFLLSFPTTGWTDEYSLVLEFSPNIINLESDRVGEIRIKTGMAYSFYIANKADENPIHVYFNSDLSDKCSGESVLNIKATRDSLGNLILRFSLEDLLALEDCLLGGQFNMAEVVVTMNNGDEYIGGQEVYLAVKRAR